MTDQPAFQWQPTSAPRATRYDDIWFLDANTGWGVNSNGEVRKTDDGGATWPLKMQLPDGVYPRCIAFANDTRGWIGTLSPNNRLWRTVDGGETWSEIPLANLPQTPRRVCGMSIVNDRVIYASGTNIPRDTPGIITTEDGGNSWRGRDLSDHASILIDCYFTDPQTGWVVGGRADVVNPPNRNTVKPVVLFTEDGGQTWVNQIAGQEDEFPEGEWGWKIHFVNENVGFVSLENFTQAAILRTDNGGKCWTRLPVNDPQGNANLEGIGFLDGNHGWVGGWGDISFQSGRSSETLDGGKTWADANHIGRFINRFRFMGDPLEVGYASGDTVYKYAPVSVPVDPGGTPDPDDPPTCGDAGTPPQGDDTGGTPGDAPAPEDEPTTCVCLSESGCRVPEGTRSLRIDVWDSFGSEVGTLVQPHPRAGRHAVPPSLIRSLSTPPERGHFIVRFTMENAAGERVVESRLITCEQLPLNRFSRIKVFLDESIEGQNIGAHGPFWRGTSRDEFVNLEVFNTAVVTIGDGANSALVRALRGDGFPQMPRGFNPMPAERIRFIEKWINDGAPSGLSDVVTFNPDEGDGLDPVQHNHYWREFDNWAAFHRPPGIQEAVGLSSGVARVWAGFARGTPSEQELQSAIESPRTLAAVQLLARRQMQTIEAHYGNPIPLRNLLESYELFGRGIDNAGLPEDPLRAGDPHQMNGPQMWFNWTAMADACLRASTPIAPEFWRGHIRAILAGLMNDGVVRGRFPVDGFDASDPDVSCRIREHVRGIPDGELQKELLARFRRTEFSLPF